jgi:hypothetical protein
MCFEDRDQDKNCICCIEILIQTNLLQNSSRHLQAFLYSNVHLKMLLHLLLMLLYGVALRRTFQFEQYVSNH